MTKEALLEEPKNPFDKVYWFARMLIHSDKYGSIGNNNEYMLGGSQIIEEMLNLIANESVTLEIAKNALFDYIKSLKREGTKVYESYHRFCDDIDEEINNERDLYILCITMRHVVVPINNMLNSIPNSDIDIAQPIAKAFLDKKGEEGLKKVIELWDELGLKACLAIERSQIVEGLGILRHILEGHHIIDKDADYVITAFVQEFERRVGQKRKGRGGRSLEDVTEFILEYFGIVKFRLVPEHLRTSLEVDKLVECKDGTYIAISCKRTFRERWKQSFTENMDTLDENNVKEIWHLITYDRDLSKDKIEEMGKHRCIIYLSDNSTLFNSDDVSKYIRPMSSFIKDIRKEIDK